MTKPYYITTPIFYVNAVPHVGTAYTAIMADILNRYHRLFGEETYFLTGVDEHGQKVQQAAEKRGLTPMEHCDSLVKEFEDAWKLLGVDYSVFFRTTAAVHRDVVQAALTKLHDAGEIYEDTYVGWYSVSEEIFYTEKDLVDGKSPEGKPVVKIEEKNYFFRMSKYQQKLIEYIDAHPDFIQPDYRRNEVLGFLRQPLNDLCISRPKTRLNWGIEIPFDRDYVTYVWFDALLNYATAVGFEQPGREAEFEKWWREGGPVHLLGKDILTTHAVYWTTMLMALGLPLPRVIFATGWILNKGHGKMSKSDGDVMNPVDVTEQVGVDELRYYLAREVHLGNDSPFGIDLVETRVNSELANNLGNLLSRSTNLVEKFFGGQKPAFGAEDEASRAIREACAALPAKVREDVERMRPSYALEHVVHTLTLANKYMEDRAPWKVAKTDLAAAGHVLAVTLEVLRVCATLLLPVMPTKAAELLRRIGVTDRSFAGAGHWPGVPNDARMTKGEPLFPRLGGTVR